MRDGTAGADTPLTSAARPAPHRPAARRPGCKGARDALRNQLYQLGRPPHSFARPSLSRHAKETWDALKHNRARFRLRHVPGRLSGRLGRGVARSRHPGTAGRSPDRKRDLDHRRRGDHYSCGDLLRAARHVLASGLRSRKCCL